MKESTINAFSHLLQDFILVDDLRFVYEAFILVNDFRVISLNTSFSSALFMMKKRIIYDVFVN